MKQDIRIGTLYVVVAACVVFGASFVQAQAPAEEWPLWAYGWLTPPQPGDKAAPQAAPLPPTQLRGDMSPKSPRAIARPQKRVNSQSVILKI